MTTDTDALIQKMVQAIYDAIPWDGAEPIPLDEMAAKDWMERDAAAVLPIVAEEVRKAKAESLRGAAEMIEDMRNSAQVAEVAAYVPGEVGRQNVIDSFDAAMEEPGDWLRSLADSGEADTYREDRVDAWLAEVWDEAHEIGWNNADEYWRTTGLIPSYSKADTYPNPHRGRR